MFRYNYKKAMLRYNEYTEMSEKDKKLCATVEAAALEATKFVERTVTYTIATPFIIGEIAMCIGGIVGYELKEEVMRCYDEYVKENGTQI